VARSGGGAAEANLTRRRRLEQSHDPEQRRLAGAVRTDHGENLSLSDREGGNVEYGAAGVSDADPRQ
jgi:hypothetical protein